MMRNLILIALLALTVGCTSQKSAENGAAESATAQQSEGAGGGSESKSSFTEPKYGTAVEAGTDMVPGPGNLKKAMFAGGCFWCMEPPFDKVDGVIATVSGYTGSDERNPEYKKVARGLTRHTEAIWIVYDPAKVSYSKLVEVFWRTHDPTDTRGQFVDRGSQYRPGIFPYTPEQREIATKSKAALDASKRFTKPVAVEITDASTFWPAEEYHQDFYKKDPSHYKRYRSGSGRDQFIARYWK